MQASIYLMIAVPSALTQRQLEGNAFQLEARIDEGLRAEDVDRGGLRVSAVGVHRPDGSIADDVTLNWIVGSLHGIPNARPVPITLGSVAQEEMQALLQSVNEMSSMAEIKAAIDAYEQQHGLVDQDPNDDLPEGFDGLPMSVEEIMAGGHLTPAIVDITGQAVEDAVIFPAQYGSPDPFTDGWYWSATVDTHKVGRHHFELHVMLHRPRLEGSVIMWDPEIHILGMELDVNHVVQTNGFTGAGLGYLPFVEPIVTEDAHV